MPDEDKREDLDFTSPTDMTLTFMSKMRGLIQEAIEEHLDEYETTDWGFYAKSNCHKVVKEILDNNHTHDKYFTVLMDEAEKMFDTEVTFRLGMIAMVNEEKI